jgi:NTE family protein
LKRIDNTFLSSIFPLFVIIFLFLKKKQKGLSLQSGLMRNCLSLLPSIVFFLFSFSSFAQDTIKKPKIGLVLSGGGAKGLAHIGVLKEIEKAGIKIDYIGGTSMGAIIGGLYACGYSANELDSIFKKTDFDELLQDFVPRGNKTFYEKRNDEKYIVSLPFQKFKLSVPRSISKGLYNYNQLSQLTYMYRHVYDFNKLKIPFICIGTNVETGEEKIFNSGSLPLALVASGAFPSLFSPVEIEGQLYIDGGVSNNYPVEEVRRMGADIIIGVDVQDDLKSRDELNGATGVLVQISNFEMIQKMKEKRKLTDIYIKPKIEGFSIISFNQGQEIIQKGVEEAKKYEADLQKLRSNYPTEHQKIVSADSIFVKEVAINKLKNYTRAYVMGKLRFNPEEKISYSDLKSGINNLNSTQNFLSINYKFIKQGASDFLSFELKENPVKTFLKFGLHFDNLFKSAALVNLTKKNLLLTNDIASLDVMLGDNFRANFDYYRDNGFYWSFGVKSMYNKFSKQAKTDFRGGELLNNFSLKSINLNYFDFTNQAYVQTIFVQKFLLGVGLEHKNLSITSNYYQDKKNFIEDSNYLSSFGFLKYDSFDNKYFPKKGWYFSGDVQTFWASTDYNKDFARHTIFKGDAGIVKTFLKKINLKMQSEAGFALGNNPNDIFNFSLGGYGFVNLNNIRPFYGYDFLELYGDSYIKASFTFDYEIWKKSHVNATVNFTNIGNNIFDDDTWISKPQYSGYALGYGMQTLIGPIEIKQSWSPETGDTYTWFSVGFWF